MKSRTRLLQVIRCCLGETLIFILVLIWDSFGLVHKGFSVEKIDGRVKVIDWVIGKGLCLINTCFEKRKS